MANTSTRRYLLKSIGKTFHTCLLISMTWHNSQIVEKHFFTSHSKTHTDSDTQTKKVLKREGKLNRNMFIKTRLSKLHK